MGDKRPDGLDVLFSVGGWWKGMGGDREVEATGVVVMGEGGSGFGLGEGGGEVRVEGGFWGMRWMVVAVGGVLWDWITTVSHQWHRWYGRRGGPLRLDM